MSKTHKQRKRAAAPAPAASPQATLRTSQTEKTSIRRLAFGAAVILAATFTVYIPALRAGFVYDDKYWLWENPLINDSVWQYWCTAQTLDYLPLTSSAFWCGWRLWGMEPFGYHFVNILLHAADAVLVWMVLRRLGVPGAWLAGLIFAVHPVNVASVAWITEVKNTLSLLLAALALLAWLEFDRGRSRRWYAGAVALFLLGLLAKPSVVVLPAVLLACAWWLRRRLTWKDVVSTLPFFAMAAAWSAVAVWFQHNRAIRSSVDGPRDIVQRLALAGRATWFYLGKALAPVDLCMIYPRWDVPQWGPLDLWPTLLAAAAAMVLWRFRKGWARPAAFGLGYCLIALSPVLGFVDMAFMAHSFVADHLQYLAIIGVIALAAGLAWRAVERRGRAVRCAAAAGGAVAVLVLAAMTFRQARLYKDELTLWTDVVSRNPASSAAQLNYAAALADAGRTDEAGRHYLRALDLNPNLAKAHKNLGTLLQKQGDLPKAIEHYLKAVAIDPEYAGAHNDLAAALANSHREDEAIKHYRLAIRLKPAMAESHYGLAVMLAAKGNTDEAAESFRKVLELRPGDPDARRELQRISDRPPRRD